MALAKHAAPDFATDLARGQLGERFIVEHDTISSWEWPKESERRWDLIRVSAAFPGDLELVEVKTDSYDRSATPNFFMELRTRVAGQPGELLGGPWRALRDGCDTFVYLYHAPERDPSTGVAYWFYDLPALVQHLDAQHAAGAYETRRVRAGRLTAVGLLVPRRTLKSLCTRVVYGP